MGVAAEGMSLALLEPGLHVALAQRLGKLTAVKECEGMQDRTHDAGLDALLLAAAEQFDDQARAGLQRAGQHDADAAGGNVINDARPGADAGSARRPHIAFATAAKTRRRAPLHANVFVLVGMVSGGGLSRHGRLGWASVGPFANICSTGVAGKTGASSRDVDLF